MVYVGVEIPSFQRNVKVIILSPKPELLATCTLPFVL